MFLQCWGYSRPHPCKAHTVPLNYTPAPKNGKFEVKKLEMTVGQEIVGQSKICLSSTQRISFGEGRFPLEIELVAFTQRYSPGPSSNLG